MGTVAKTPSKPRKSQRGNRNIRWIEKHLRVPEGRDVGRPVKLRAWQRREVKKIYDNPFGTRRAILSFGRKNGKTALAAMLLLLHTVGPEAKPNSSLHSAAQSREQAAILFNLAAKMVRMSPTLYPFVGIRDTAKELYCVELGTLYRALSADSTTAFGLSPSFIVHDELGQVKGPRSTLYEALETATAAQEQPLTLIISTQAPTDADLLSVLIDDGLAGHDPRVVVSLYTAPDDIDPFSEKAVRLANPAFGDFQNADEVRAQADDARRMPSREPEFRNLILNQRVETSSPFISRKLWETCSSEPMIRRGAKVWGGLDLSEINDLTALVLLSPDEDVWDVESTFWLPAEGLRERSRSDRVPYDQWANEGYLETVPGKTVDYEYVARFLRDRVFDEYDVQAIAFDRWNFRHLKPWLLKERFTQEQIDAKFVEFGQGFQSMSPALRDLEGMILNGKIRHGGHPVLSMCARNAVVDRDGAGNRKLVKQKSRGRIDGMVSLAMAASLASAHEFKPAPTYQMMVFGR